MVCPGLAPAPEDPVLASMITRSSIRPEATSGDKARMQAVAARLRASTGRGIEVLPADLTNRADLAHVEGRLAGDTAIAVLVNNAGVSLKGGLLESGSDVLEKL